MERNIVTVKRNWYSLVLKEHVGGHEKYYKWYNQKDQAKNELEARQCLQEVLYK